MRSECPVANGPGVAVRYRAEITQNAGHVFAATEPRLPEVLDCSTGLLRHRPRGQESANGEGEARSGCAGNTPHFRPNRSDLRIRLLFNAVAAQRDSEKGEVDAIVEIDNYGWPADCKLSRKRLPPITKGPPACASLPAPSMAARPKSARRCRRSRSL